MVCITAVQAAGLSTLEERQPIQYQLETDKKGKIGAVNLKKIG
ncbi:hypothetical protein ACFWPU_25555 [Streptomyces sp. NPDC058471]